MVDSCDNELRRHSAGWTKGTVARAAGWRRSDASRPCLRRGLVWRGCAHAALHALRVSVGCASGPCLRCGLVWRGCAHPALLALRVSVIGLIL